jgi:hypothetical protein
VCGDHDLKGLLKGIATRQCAALAGVLPAVARQTHPPTSVSLTQARRIAAITQALWKKGASFDVERLKSRVDHRYTSKVH